MITPTEIPKSALGETPEALLLPYQQSWIADESGLKLYTKSRRIGVTWADAAGAALLAAQLSGRNTFYLGYERDMARDYIAVVGEWGRAYSMACSEVEETEEIFRDGDEDKAINVFRVHFNSGYRVEALSSTPRNLRGKQGDVVIDEAAFHDLLPEVLKAAKALRIWGGRVRLITTYNGIDNDFYQLEQDVLAGRLPYARHFTTFEDAISQGFFRRVCLLTGRQWSPAAEAEFVEQTYAEFGDDADEELRCIPKRSGGRYFPSVLIEQAMQGSAPVVSYECPDGWATQSVEVREGHAGDWLEDTVAPLLTFLQNPDLKTVYGMDFGRSGDLSVINFSQVLPNLTRAAMLGVELRNVPFDQQRQILWWICDRIHRLSSGAHDSRGNGQHLAELTMQRYGSNRIHQVMLSRPWYAEHFPRYKAGMEDGRLQLPPSSDWKDDHAVVVIDKGIPVVPDGKNKGADKKQRHGDAAIACVLMWYASLNEGAPITYQAAARPLSGDAWTTPAAVAPKNSYAVRRRYV
jgi:phage FluMu gp28-like protein